MEIFAIYDGRPAFWQWDTDQKLIIADASCTQVHFDNGTMENAMLCETKQLNGKKVVDVPPELLQTPAPLQVYFYVNTTGGGMTKCAQQFSVIPRPKPADYIYTETERWTAEKAVEKALQEAKERGELGNANIDDESTAEDATWSSKKLDEEFNLRGGGRFGKYDAKTPGWKRILNIIRASSGTLNLGLVQPSLGYSMVQYASLDVGGCVQFHNDRNTPTAKPIIRQWMNHMYGEDKAMADPARQARITKVRVAYPKRDTTYPIPDSKGEYKSAANPINCYVDVYLDFDPEWKNNGYDVTRSFVYNFSGMTDSHNCAAITEEMDATDTGMYGEELEYFEYELQDESRMEVGLYKATLEQAFIKALTAGGIKIDNATFNANSGGIEIRNGKILLTFDSGALGSILLDGNVLQLDYKNLKITNGRAQIGYGLNTVTGTLREGTSNNSSLGWRTKSNASCQLVFGSESEATENAYGTMVTGLNTIADYGWMLLGGKYNKKRTSATPLFVIGNGTSTADSDRSNAFEIFANGNAAVQNTISSSNGADYAEFFEWLDGNPDNEDRVGLAVCLEGDKIRLAQAGDDVLGIISGTAFVLGDSASMHWQGKYQTDEYGRLLFDMVEEFAEVEDPETGETKTVSTGFFPHPRLHPDYDPEAEYIPREDRPEWDKVGLMGKLYVRDDGTCTAGDYGCVGADGVLTRSQERTDIRVMKRTSDNIVLVLMK